MATINWIFPWKMVIFHSFLFVYQVCAMASWSPLWVSNLRATGHEISHWDAPALLLDVFLPGAPVVGASQGKPHGLNCKKKPMEKRWKNHGFRNVLSMNWIWTSGIGDFFERNNILLLAILAIFRLMELVIPMSWRYNSFNPSGLVLFTHQSHGLIWRYCESECNHIPPGYRWFTD